MKFHPSSLCSRVVSHLAIFAVMLTLAAQPAHLLACCVSSSFQHNQQSGKNITALKINDPAVEAVAIVDTDGIVITPGVVEASHHHHVSCCENCDYVVQSQKVANSEFPQRASLFARVEPAFVIDADFFAHRPTRAGPSDTRIVSIHLSSLLLGRAPPLSA